MERASGVMERRSGVVQRVWSDESGSGVMESGLE